MVFINLRKFVLLIQAIHACLPGIPYRGEKLFEAYSLFEALSEDVISVSVSTSLERLKEINLDEEDPKQRKAIVFEIVNQYSTSSFKFPSDSSKIYLISPLDVCDICKKGKLVVVKPKRLGRNANVYTRDGGRTGNVYHKQCNELSCLATVFSSYTEFKKGDVIMRKYLDFSNIKFFSITQETFFDTNVMNELTEDIFTCRCRVTNFVKKYNRLHGSIPMNKKRILDAWLIFSIGKRLPFIEFPVLRNRDRAIDIEAVCKYLYPDLKRLIDSKWLDHVCKICETRTVIMDGAAKAYRTVCSAKSEKITSVGALNEFTACGNSPLPKNKFCEVHVNDQSGDTPERLDIGMITRSMRREMGLDIDFLTTTEGCRKREAINVRSVRSKTAGMLYAYRPCGISIGHTECLHAETCTDFVLLLIEMFGTRPGPERLTGVAIDRSCDVHPYIRRIGKEGSEASEIINPL